MLREMPADLVQELSDKFHFVFSIRRHHLDWRLRKNLYPLFGSPQDSFVERVRGHLAVLTSEHVLAIESPILRHWGDLPNQILNGARGLLTGEVDERTADELMDTGYNIFGHWTGRDPDYTFRRAAIAQTTYKAINEVRGYLKEPFESAEYYTRLIPIEGAEGYATFSGSKPTDSIKGTDKYTAVSGANWTDIDWTFTAACGDTAGAASVAYACTEDSRTLDPQKSLEFWTWWLVTAIPEAWSRANTE